MPGITWSHDPTNPSAEHVPPVPRPRWGCSTPGTPHSPGWIPTSLAVDARSRPSAGV